MQMWLILDMVNKPDDYCDIIDKEVKDKEA